MKTVRILRGVRNFGDKEIGAALPVALRAHCGRSKRFHKATSMTCFSTCCIFCQRLTTAACTILVVVTGSPLGR